MESKIVKAMRLATSPESRYSIRKYVCDGIAGILGVLLVAGFAAAQNPPTPPFPYPTNGDPTNQIRFDTIAGADSKRQQLIDYIWSDGLPTSLPTVNNNISFPSNLNGINQALVSRIDELKAHVFGMDSTSYVIRPINTDNLDRTVIFCGGHEPLGSTPMGGCYGDTVNRLLRDGYSVVAMHMPLQVWNTDGSVDLPGGGTVTIDNYGSSVAHNEMFDKLIPALPDGDIFRFFLEPVVQSINHIQNANPNLKDISMVGISGGGWTTHMAAAIDTRIKLSVPIAGSAPLYVSNDWGWGRDYEQVYSPLYNENIASNGSGGGVATWLENYTLGGYGTDRLQIMVTNQYEPDGLFPGTFADSFKGVVSNVVENYLQQGQWKHVYDTSQDKHTISPWTIDSVIMPALNGPDMLTQSATAPTVDGADIAQLTAGPVVSDANLRSVFYQRPAQGQTFTTGSNPEGYLLKAVTVQALWSQTVNSLFLDIGAVDGGILTQITPTHSGGSISAVGGNYVTITLGSPLYLDPDTQYGFNLSTYNWSESAGGINLVCGDGDSYSGGSLYISGLEPTNTYGYPDNDNLDIHTELDRVFHLDMDAVGVAPPAAPGDANGDGKVDEADAAILACYWLQTGGATWSDGDFNADGNVNEIDATIMASNWYYGISSNYTVPEPSLLIAISTGFLLWGVRAYIR